MLSPQYIVAESQLAETLSKCNSGHSHPRYGTSFGETSYVKAHRYSHWESFSLKDACPRAISARSSTAERQLWSHIDLTFILLADKSFFWALGLQPSLWTLIEEIKCWFTQCRVEGYVCICWSVSINTTKPPAFKPGPCYQLKTFQYEISEATHVSSF